MALPPEKKTSLGRPVRLIILTICLALYAGGVWQAWQALRTQRIPYPREALVRLSQHAQDLPMLPNAVHCVPFVDLNLAFILPASETSSSTPTTVGNRGPSFFKAAGSAAAHALRTYVSPLLDIRHTITAIHPEQHTTSHFNSNSDRQRTTENGTSERAHHTHRTVLPLSSSYIQMGWEMFSLLPSAGRDEWTVLVFTDDEEVSITGLRNRTNGSVHSQPQKNGSGSDGEGTRKGRSSSAALSERVLLVVVATGGGDGTAHDNFNGSTMTRSENKLAALVAAEVAAWLLGDIPGGGTGTGGGGGGDKGTGGNTHQALMSIQKACLGGAASAIRKFLKLVDEFEVPITPSTASTAHLVVDSFTSALRSAALEEEEEGGGGEGGDFNHRENNLERSRETWRVAQALSRHPDLGVTPGLPTEHSLALLLPIALPITLALVRAIGFEISVLRGKHTAPIKQE